MAGLDRALYRLLLRLYPAEFRRAHAAELEAIYAHCLAVERGRRGRVLARIAALADALRAAWSLRRSAHPRAGGFIVLLGSLAQDVRIATRTFRRAPLFFGGLVLVLALGVGANGAIFSLVQAVLLEPLPYRDPDRLALLYRSSGESSGIPGYNSTLDSVQVLREQAAAVVDVATVVLWQGNLEAQMDLLLADGAERLRGALVSPNFFEVLGVNAARGRVFSSADETTPGQPIVVSEAFWTRVLGRDPAVVGRSLRLVTGRGTARAAQTMTIVGVLPRDVRFTYPQETEVWALQRWGDIAQRRRGGFQIIARVRPGVPFADAHERIAALSERAALPTGWRMGLQPMTGWIMDDVRPSMLLLAGVSALLLLITCATIATALMSRHAERHRELAVRASLGAARGRLIRQLATEGAVLSVAGTAAGLLITIAALPIFRAIVPTVVPRADEIAVRPWLFVFGAATAAIVAVLATVLPATQAANVDLITGLKRTSSTGTVARAGTRWRQIVVGSQAALATALLIGSALLLVSFWRLGRVDLGYDPDGIVTVEMRIVDGRFSTPALMRTMQDDMLARVRAIPGVLAAGLTTAVPFRGVDFVYSLQRSAGSPRVAGHGRTVDPAYFEIMRVPLKRGRIFGPAESSGSPLAVVISESFAARMFGPDDPLGQTIDPDEPATVIGVVGDTRTTDVGSDPMPAIYYSRVQRPSELFCLVVRHAPGVDVAGAVRQAVWQVDPKLPAMNLTTIDQIVSASVADRRFYTTTTSVFAGLALLLTATGLMVVIARSVVERRREMAIRLALGARPAALVRLVTRQGLRPVLAGTTAGLVMAWFAARVIEQFLFGVTVREPGVYGGAAALTMVVAVVACLLPARRLAAIAPAGVLRGD